MYDIPDNKRRWSRRIVLSTGGMGVVGAGAMIYQAAPGFWQQYTSELRRPVHPAPKIPDPAKWPDKGLHAAWLGHSTVLMKIDGYTIMTDPVFSTRAGLHLGPVTLGVKRLVEPALKIRAAEDRSGGAVARAHGPFRHPFAAPAGAPSRPS